MSRTQQLSPRSVPRVNDRLRGLAATVLLLLLVVGFPLVLIGIGAAPWDANLGQLRPLLTGPDDGTLALDAIAVIGWIAWAVVVVSVGLAVAAEVRGLQAPSIPGFALPQQAAARLVATAALMFIATPTALAAFPTAPAHASVPAPVLEDPPAVTKTPTPLPATQIAAPVVEPQQAHAPVTTDYIVRRGDSLWKIAERCFGDPYRYPELEEINRSILGDDPSFLPVGEVIKLPVPEVDTRVDGAHEVVVQPGQTLSEIAQDELGDARDYRAIFDASTHTRQPNGQHLTNPNLIRPGWKLTIPTTPPRVQGPAAPAPIEPPAMRNLAPPRTASTPANASHDADEPIVPGETQAADQQDEVPSWLLPGLTGAGALLSGSLFTVIRARRRTQQRYRRPGFTIAPPPDTVRNIEKTAMVAGSPTAEAIAQLDKLLRHLAAHAEPVPQLNAVEVDPRAVTLHLSESADLPAPWEGADKRWTANLDAPVTDHTEQLPPYPLLATVGQSDDGHLWLLNLERFGSINLTGDAEQARALARHLTADLALSPWGLIVDVDTIGVAPELTDIDAGHVSHHSSDDSTFLRRLLEGLQQARHEGTDDPEPFQTLLTSGTPNEDLRDIADLVRTQEFRSGVALVSLLTPPQTGDLVVDLTPDGRLQIPQLGLDLTAAGLTSSEAEACAAILNISRNTTVIPIPHEEGADGWRALADQAGALTENLTEHRPLGDAGAASLLPEAVQRYEAVATTTAEDVETLAPVIPDKTRKAVREADPELEADLAEWSDPESRLPKLRLLGPVTVTAKRPVVNAVAERRAYFTELVAFLALHPAGVSSQQVCEAFGISKSRARTDLGFIRAWFGLSPRTGRPHLPAATTSPAHADRGSNGYQLSDVLVDLDLFRRLRLRAQARGADGMADLVAALELVNGEPFASLRTPGWNWLLDGERVHEIARFMVVDVAHLVGTDALSRGDVERAKFAAETGCKGSPYDDACRLDLAKVAEVEGHTELAEQILKEGVFNRSDDEHAPIDLPDRTARVVRDNDWGNSNRHRRP